MDKKTESLIKGYLEKAEEKLRCAEMLLEGSGYDDAISRAYYACFHVAQAVLLTEGLSIRSHSGLVNLFGLHFVKSGKIEEEYGQFLSELKDKRENGDYQIYSAIGRNAAEEAVRNAKRFVARMDEYLNSAFTQRTNKKNGQGKDRRRGS